MKKHPVMLLELCIAMILMAGIVAILFSSYRELSIAKAELKQDKEAVFTRQRLKLRLGQLFSQLGSWKKIDEEHYFFSYDNGADLDPAFRGKVKGMISLEKGGLCLTTWPEKGDPRQEVLSDKGGEFILEFFDHEKGEWSEEYPAEKPFMMKLKFAGEEFPFFL